LTACRFFPEVFLFVVLGFVAESFGSENETESRALDCFQSGKDLFKSEQYAEAAAKFREAYELKPTWKLFYNIGQSEAAAKRHGLALEVFERFLSEGGDDIVEARRDQVLYEVERLRKIVGFLKIKAPEGTRLFVDDVLRGTAPVLMALPVAVGIQHVVQGDLGGAALGPKAFRVTGGQTVVIELKGETERTVETAAQEGPVEENPPISTEGAVGDNDGTLPPPREEMKSPLVVPGWAIGATGAGVAAAGGILGIIALSKNSKLVDDCGDEPCPEYADDEKSLKKMANVSTALLAAGGTIFVTGVVLLIVGKRQEKQSIPMASVVPFVDRKMAAVSLDWRF